MTSSSFYKIIQQDKIITQNDDINLRALKKNPIKKQPQSKVSTQNDDTNFLTIKNKIKQSEETQEQAKTPPQSEDINLQTVKKKPIKRQRQSKTSPQSEEIKLMAETKEADKQLAKTSAQGENVNLETVKKKSFKKQRQSKTSQQSKNINLETVKKKPIKRQRQSKTSPQSEEINLMTETKEVNQQQSKTSQHTVDINLKTVKRKRSKRPRKLKTASQSKYIHLDTIMKNVRQPQSKTSSQNEDNNLKTIKRKRKKRQRYIKSLTKTKDNNLKTLKTIQETQYEDQNQKYQTLLPAIIEDPTVSEEEQQNQAQPDIDLELSPKQSEDNKLKTVNTIQEKQPHEEQKQIQSQAQQPTKQQQKLDIFPAEKQQKLAPQDQSQEEQNKQAKAQNISVHKKSNLAKEENIQEKKELNILLQEIADYAQIQEITDLSKLFEDVEQIEKGICKKDIAIQIIQSLYEDIISDEVRLLYSTYQTKNNNFDYQKMIAKVQVFLQNKQVLSALFDKIMEKILNGANDLEDIMRKISQKDCLLTPLEMEQALNKFKLQPSPEIITAIFTIMNLQEVGTVEIESFIHLLSIHFNDNDYHLRQTFVLYKFLQYKDILSKMKEYFQEKYISIKEFFIEQGIEDNEDLLIDAQNFEYSMDEIFGEDNEDIWDQISQLYSNELLVEQIDGDKVSIKKLIEIFDDYEKHIQVEVVQFKIHAEPYDQVEKVFEEKAEPYDPGPIKDYYYFRGARSYASCFIYDIYNKNKRFRNAYKTQIREIWYLSLDELIDALYSLMQFSVCSQKFTGHNDSETEKWFVEQHQQQFQKFFEYWVEEQDENFQLYITEEKLILLKDYLDNLKKLPLTEQKQKIKDICYVLYGQPMWIFRDQGNLKYYFDYRFDQILIRKNGTIDNGQGPITMDIPAYTFRSKFLFQAGVLSEDIKSQITEDKFKCSIFYDLFQYLKFQNLDVEELESYQDYKQFINKSIDKSIKNKPRIDKSKLYERIDFIAKGTYGNVFSIRKKDQKDSEVLVWKEQSKEDLFKLSTTLLEISFNLLLDFQNQKLPLIKAVDVFIQKINDNDNNLTPYQINIIMEKADKEDLKCILKNKKRMDFFTLFSLLKDILIGLTRMDLSYLAHRDVKPANILIKNKKYLLADYGEGLNLFHDSKKFYNMFYQVGKWPLKGTPLYLDPILKRVYDMNQKIYDEKKQMWDLEEELDIFKADIYSFGLILYKAATGKDINKMNSNKQLQNVSYNNIHKLNLPIHIKQLILNMIDFEQCNRMNIMQINSYVKQFIQLIKTSEQIQSQQSPEENQKFKQIVKFDHIHQDWFEVDKFEGLFNYSIMRQQTQYEGTYFIGSQKLDFNEKEKQNQVSNKIVKDQIILIKPNYLLTIFKEKISSDECLVLLNNEPRIIRQKDIQTIQFPSYQTNQILEVYDSEQDIWQVCTLENVINEEGNYQLRDQQNSTTQVPFNSLKLRRSLCHENLISGDVSNSFQYQKINEQELELLTYDHSVINWSQLFEMDIDLNDVTVTEQKVLDTIKEFKRNHLSKGNVNIYDSVSAIDKFSRIEFGNQLRICCFRGFKIQVLEKHLNIFEYQPMQLLYLDPSETQFTFDQMIRIFKIFSVKKLRRFALQIEKITDLGEPTSTLLAELNQVFSSFIMNQKLIYEFFLKIVFDTDFLWMQQFEKIQDLIHNQQNTLEKFDFVARTHSQQVKSFAALLGKDMNNKWNFEGGLRNQQSELWIEKVE